MSDALDWLLGGALAPAGELVWGSPPLLVALAIGGAVAAWLLLGG